jgi:hypothetical protein
MRSRSQARQGYTAADALVVLVLIAVSALVLLMAMPRNRETLRLTTCQKNLAQIGLALALYDQTQRGLPVTGRPAPADSAGLDRDSGPLKVLLETLGLENFQGLTPQQPAPAAGGRVPAESPVPGFVCASDPHATAGLFRAPVNYRAATGGDALGTTGVFAPGRRSTLAQIEQADGASFTAGFSERLVGDGIADHVSAANFAVARAALPADGCSGPWLAEIGARWHADAGSSWVASDYRSTLYTHVLRPDAPISCMTPDGSAAFMGASSGHSRGVSLLMMDGSVKLVVPTIDPAVWREFAVLHDPEPSPATP